MENLENRERFEKVINFLIKIATGNFTPHIERTDRTDELEALTALVNIVAEEIKDSFLHQGFVNTDISYIELVHMVFFLDRDSLIVYMNEDVHQLLNYGQKELLNKPFGKILHKDSMQKWNRQKRDLLAKRKMEKNLRLNFMTKDGLVLTEFCKLIMIPKETDLSARIMVITSNIIKDKSRLEGKLKRDNLGKVHQTRSRGGKTPIIKGSFSLEDIENIRSIGTYLRHHPERHVHSLKELALAFGTNEYKLKRGFSEFFGMTVFRFLKNERLKNAHLSIRNTRERFKNIAHQNGFRNASHFTQQFRARYGYTPRELRENS